MCGAERQFVWGDDETSGLSVHEKSDFMRVFKNDGRLAIIYRRTCGLTSSQLKAFRSGGQGAGVLMTTKPVSSSGGRMVYLTANLLCLGGTMASSLPLAARAGMPLAGVAQSWIRSGTGESSSPDVCSTKDEIVESGSTSLSLSFKKMRPGMYSFGRPTCSSGWVHHAPFSRSGTGQARGKAT